MRAMNKRIIKAFPVVFSLRNDGNYFDIISHADPHDRMAATWSRVGDHMTGAIKKVSAQVVKERAHTGYQFVSAISKLDADLERSHTGHYVSNKTKKVGVDVEKRKNWR